LIAPKSELVIRTRQRKRFLLIGLSLMSRDAPLLSLFFSLAVLLFRISTQQQAGRLSEWRVRRVADGEVPAGPDIDLHLRRRFNDHHLVVVSFFLYSAIRLLVCTNGKGGLSVLSKMCQGQPSNMNANGGGGCSQSTQDMCASLLDCAKGNSVLLRLFFLLFLTTASKGTRADCQCGANGEISGASCLTATSNESSPPSSASASQLTILYTTIFLCVIAAIFV
jgi:hypothetical protein